MVPTESGKEKPIRTSRVRPAQAITGIRTQGRFRIP